MIDCTQHDFLTKCWNGKNKFQDKRGLAKTKIIKIQAQQEKHMQNHFCRLFSFLVRLRNTPTQNIQSVDFHITQIPQLTIPDKLSSKQSNKLMHSLYRRLKMVVASFQIQDNLKADLDIAFQQSKQAQVSLLQFFSLCCSRVTREINLFKKQKKEEKPNFRILNRYSEPKQKATHKKLSQTLCITIYNILDDLQIIQASYMFVQGKQIDENVNSVYTKVKGRNKKIKKQIMEYRENYNNRMQRKSQSLSRSWYSRTHEHIEKKQIQFITRNLSNSSGKSKKGRYQSEIKSVSKNSTEKQKYKLQPPVQKVRLKLLR